MTALSLISAASAALGLTVGFAVLMQNRRSRLHQTFFLLSMAIAVFAFAEFGYRLSESAANAAVWLRIFEFSPIVLPLIFLFTLYFTESRRHSWHRYLAAAFFISAALFSTMDEITNEISGDLIPTPWGWGHAMPHNPWYHLFAVWTSAILIAASYLSFRFYRRSAAGTIRQQARYVALAIMLISVITIVIDTGLPYVNIELPELTTLGYACANILIAYAMWRHRLFVLNPAAAADTILETMSDALFLIAPDGTVQFANGAAERLFGMSRKSLSGRRFESLLDTGDRVLRPAADGAFAVTTPLRDIPATALRSGGDRTALSIAASTMRDATGAVLGTVVAARDIAERVRAEDALKESHALLDERVRQRTEELSKVNLTLAEERERLSVTLRSIGDGVIATDMHGSIIFMNDAAEHLTGYSSAEAAGKPVRQVLSIVDRNIRTLAFDPAAEVFRTGERMELSTASLLRTKDGSERIIDDSAAPIRDASGRILGVVVVFRDVTEKEKLEEELFKAKRLESVGILAGGIAHDFNNLLTGINNSLFMCKIIAGANTDLVTTINAVEREVLRAHQLSAQLLTFAHGGDPVLAVGSLQALVRESIGFFCSGSNSGYELDFAPGMMNVMMDRGMMEQVLGNLVINAEEAMPMGGTIHLSGRNTIITAKRMDGETNTPVQLPPGIYVRLTVMDAGVGISHEIRDKIFDPFFSTKGKGRGLGLSIVQSIVRKHGGAVVAVSNPEKGAAFHIYLPAVEQSTPEQIDGRDDYNPLTMENCHEHLLLMDDDETIRRTTGKVLDHLGYRTELAANGEEAVALFRRARESRDPFDVLILDLTVPGAMGGKECLDRIRETDPFVNAIVASGYSNDPILSDYAVHGFREMLKKPYSIKELAEVIRTTLTLGQSMGR
jgi:PAS domain S-box-containing protein